MQTKMPYYIFLDIDGTLWDAAFAYAMHGPSYEYLRHPRLKPSSIRALNYLINALEEVYDVKLVITSRRRKDMEDCVNYLKEYGMQYDKPIDRTDYVKGMRGDKIIKYLKDHGEIGFSDKDSNGLQKLIQFFKNNNFDRYVVIDDSRELLKGIPLWRQIITDPNKHSLGLSHVKRYLAKVKFNKQEIESLEQY